MTDLSLYFLESVVSIDDLQKNAVFLNEINSSTAATDLFSRNSQNLATAKTLQLALLGTSKDFTFNGMEIKKAVALYFHAAAGALSSYGAKVDDSDLTPIVKIYTYSALYKQKPIQLVADCDYILSFMNKFSGPLLGYKIDAGFNSTLQTLRGQMENLTKLPKNYISLHKNNNKKYLAHEKLMRTFLKEEFDTFMKIYKIFNIDFYMAYTSARKVRHHHLKRKAETLEIPADSGVLQITAYDNVNVAPLAGVSFAAPQLNFTILSDNNGEIYKNLIAPGDYTATMLKAGYKEKTITFKIEAGKATKINVLMERL